MKKILTMILSLALVLSMIPATASVAFAASGNGTVTITTAEGKKTYTVTVDPATFTYSGKVLTPNVKVLSQDDQTEYTTYTKSYEDTTSGGGRT